MERVGWPVPVEVEGPPLNRWSISAQLMNMASSGPRIVLLNTMRLALTTGASGNDMTNFLATKTWLLFGLWMLTSVWYSPGTRPILRASLGFTIPLGSGM